MKSSLIELLIVSVFLYLLAPVLGIFALVVVAVELLVSRAPKKEPVTMGS